MNGKPLSCASAPMRNAIGILTGVTIARGRLVPGKRITSLISHPHVGFRIEAPITPGQRHVTNMLAMGLNSRHHQLG
jgi:hypothetical protein